MRTWDEIASHYTQITPTSRYEALAKGMLALLNELRVEPTFRPLIKSTSHLTLVLGMVGHKRLVHIDWLDTNRYEIYLDHSENGFYGQPQIVTLDEMVTTLQSYLNRLSEDTPISNLT